MKIQIGAAYMSKRAVNPNRPWLAKRPIAVAGAVCTAEPILRLAADWPSLNLLGYVEDLPATFAATKATLTPVEGTGLKIKMLEALEHGKPVFASDSARAGLPPGHGACVFGLDRRTIETLLDDPNALSAAELAAFQFHAILSDPPDRARFKVWIESALG